MMSSFVGQFVIIAKLSQAKPQLQLSWLALASYFYTSDLGDIVLTHCSLVYFLGCQYCYTKYKPLKSLFWKLRVKNIFLIFSSMSESNTAIEEKSQKDRVLTASKTMWMLTACRRVILGNLLKS